MPSRSSNCRLLSVLMLAAAAGSALAQAPDAKTAQDPASVEGVVTNALTAEPVLRAHVGLRNWSATPGKYGALTDAQGRFSIKRLPPGPYWLSVERVGFVALQPDGRAENQVVLRPGEARDDVAIKLTPTGAISGRVTGVNGEPIESISVSAVEGDSGGPSSRTDENGRFRIGGLRPGRYRVKASSLDLLFAPETRTDGTTETHYLPTWFPSSTSRKSVARVQVSPGRDTSGIEIALVQAPVVCVSGRVTGIPPEAEAVFLAIRTIDGFGSGSPVRRDGSFQVCRLVPGRNTFYASWRGLDHREKRSGPVEVDVGAANIENVELMMIPPFDIPGRVEIEDAPAVQPRQPPRPVARQLRLDPADLIGADVKPAEVSADGSFKFEHVPPGRFRLGLNWGGYVRAMRLGQTDIEGPVLDLRYGSGGGELTVFVSTATGEVSGTVRDENGNPAAATVALMRNDPGGFERWPVTMAASGEKGAYTLHSVTPGRYRIVVVRTSELPSRSWAAVLDEDDSAETIEIRANEKLTKDLTLRVREDQ